MTRSLKFAGWSLALVLVVLIIIRLRKDFAAPVSAVGREARVGSERRDAGPKVGSSEDPVRVTTLTVRAAPFAESVVATGTLRAEESVDLQAEVSGKIVAINFQEGRRVQKGELLMKINDAELVAMQTRARARLELARLRAARFSKLAAVGGINEQDYDTVQSELAVQQSELDLIEAQIAKTELRAPFDGIIGLRFVSEGSFITATNNNAVRIATLQSIDKLKVDFALPEKYAGKIRIGNEITFVLAGYDRPFHGSVYAFEPRIDVNTRTVLLRALCPNEGAILVPGAFATVQMKFDQLESALLIPAGAVVPGATEKTVFVLQDGKAVRRGVQTGTRTESSVQILSGLKAGDVLIISGLQQLRPGQAVRGVMTEEASTDRSAAVARTETGHSADRPAAHSN